MGTWLLLTGYFCGAAVALTIGAVGQMPQSVLFQGAAFCAAVAGASAYLCMRAYAQRR